MQPGRRRQPGLGVMLLIYHLFTVIGIDRIPPVTLSLVGLQVAIFLRLFYLPWYRASEVCISAYNVWRRKQYMRLLYGAFEHGDDMHLYYNMLSFAYKGQSLERKYGSIKFLYLVACFTVLTNVILVALGHFASRFDPDFESQCAIGFSGVIFALKVLTTYYDSGYSRQFMGIPIPIPARYAVWAELIYIQLLVPNASFLGHLAGILVGTAYVKGPLKFVMDTFYSIITCLYSPSSYEPRFTPRAEATGHRDSKFNDYIPSGMSEQEQLRRAMEESTEEELLRRAQEESMQQSFSSPNYNAPPYPTTSTSNLPPPPGFVFGDMPSAPPPPGFVPDMEELRRKREARFSNY